MQRLTCADGNFTVLPSGASFCSIAEQTSMTTRVAAIVGSSSNAAIRIQVITDVDVPGKKKCKNILPIKIAY